MEMDYIKMLREDKDLSELLCDVCDIDIFPDFRTPQDEGGHLTFNISGKTFAGAGSGSEYILLEDGSVGYWGSEGECGRIADSLKDFFEFVINCPYWQDYLYEEEYDDKEELAVFAKEIFEEHVENAQEIDFDLPQAQKELAECMGMEKEPDIASILMRF